MVNFHCYFMILCIQVEVSGGRGKPSTLVDKDESLGKVKIIFGNRDSFALSEIYISFMCVCVCMHICLCMKFLTSC